MSRRGVDEATSSCFTCRCCYVTQVQMQVQGAHQLKNKFMYLLSSSAYQILFLSTKASQILNQPHDVRVFPSQPRQSCDIDLLTFQLARIQAPKINKLAALTSPRDPFITAINTLHWLRFLEHLDVANPIFVALC